MKTILSQKQIQMIKPQFNLALACENATIGYRGKALIDTGFDGYLVINREVRNFLNPKLENKVRVYTGNNQELTTLTYKIEVVFETLDQDYYFEAEAIYLPDEPQVVIGSKFIQDICISENVNLVFDYLDKKLSFVIRD